MKLAILFPLFFYFCTGFAREIKSVEELRGCYKMISATEVVDPKLPQGLIAIAKIGANERLLKSNYDFLKTLTFDGVVFIRLPDGSIDVAPFSPELFLEMPYSLKQGVIYQKYSGRVFLRCAESFLEHTHEIYISYDKDDHIIVDLSVSEWFSGSPRKPMVHSHIVYEKADCPNLKTIWK